ncbi:MAG: YceD family protein, partial [Bacteroidota bacterium]
EQLLDAGNGRMLLAGSRRREGTTTLAALISRLLINRGDEAREESVDIIVIPHGELVLDVAQHIYEYISLQVPMRVVHPDDSEGRSGCDPEVIRKLEEEPEHQDPIEDPRWDALKKLKK